MPQAVMRQVSGRMNSYQLSSCYPTLSPKKRAKGWGTGRLLFKRSEAYCRPYLL